MRIYIASSAPVERYDRRAPITRVGAVGRDVGGDRVPGEEPYFDGG